MSDKIITNNIATDKQIKRIAYHKLTDEQLKRVAYGEALLTPYGQRMLASKLMDLRARIAELERKPETGGDWASKQHNQWTDSETMG